MFRGDDILNVYDEDLNMTGTATREKVHAEGLLHQVAHVWMFQRQDDEINILMQQRALSRELYPGKYDLIQTTHFEPGKSDEYSIIHSFRYYLGTEELEEEDIIHLGSLRQHINQGSYHDNALVQVYAVKIRKAMFIMPETEEIVKVRYPQFRDFVHGSVDHVDLYTLDDTFYKTSKAEDWWIRREEFLDVVEPSAEDIFREEVF